VGGTPGFHFSAGVGVGWFPLAPGEVYVPGYRVSRSYVNYVNVTNTNVSVTRVTNVYNTVVVKRNTTINNVTYVNQRVNGGVTVVSHDTFVNARPVARSMMRVDAHEVERAPVTRVVSAEPARTSVVGAGRAVNARPPAAVVSRTVVALRTPPAPPRSIEQRQAQFGGRFNEQALVRPAGPARPAPVGSQEGFRPFGPPHNPNRQMRPTAPTRSYEQQGNAEEANRNQQPNRNVEPPTDRGLNERAIPQSQSQMRRSPEEAHPLVRPTPPVQQRTPQQERQQEEKFNQWRQQRPSPPPSQRQPQSRPQPQHQERPSKK
jgi:hypothetical protein